MLKLFDCGEHCDKEAHEDNEEDQYVVGVGKPAVRSVKEFVDIALKTRYGTASRLISDRTHEADGHGLLLEALSLLLYLQLLSLLPNSDQFGNGWDLSADGFGFGVTLQALSDWFVTFH